MRPVDECLESLGSLPEPARRLRLRRLGDLAATPDADEVLDRLLELHGGPCDGLARLASARWRSDADRAWIRRAGGDPVAAPESGGLGWRMAPEEAEPADAPGLAVTAAEELDALVPALRHLAEAPGAAGTHALDALATLGTSRAAEALSEITLEAPRRLAALVLHGGPETAAAAAACLGEVAQDERASLLPFFAHLPAGPPAAELDRALAGDEAARQAAAHALEGSPVAEALPRLRKLLTDPDPWTRIHAIESLGALAPPDLAELLPLADPEPAVRAAALRAVARGASTPEATLAAGLDDEDALVRVTAWCAWRARVGDTEAVAAAREAALTNPDPQVVEAAALACAAEAPERAARAAQRLIECGDALHLLAGLSVLPILDDPGATDALRVLYREANAPRLRDEALRALGIRAARFPEALFALQEALEDPGSRILAGLALASAHPVAREEAVASLAGIIDSEEDDVRAASMTRSLVLAGPGGPVVRRLLANLREAGGELAVAANWTRAWIVADASPATPPAVDPVLRGLDLELAWSQGRGSIGELGELLESAPPPARRHLVGLAREVAAAARLVGTAGRLAPLARRLRLKESLRCPLPDAAASSTSSPSQAAYMDWQSARIQMRERFRRRPTPARRDAPFRPRRVIPTLELPKGLATRLGQGALEAAIAQRHALAEVASFSGGTAGPGLLRSLLAATAGILLALGLRAALGPAMTMAPTPAQAPEHAPAASRPAAAAAARHGEAPARAPGGSKVALDQGIEELAVIAGVKPTGACPLFEHRWLQLRQWLMAELAEGPTLCTYTQLMRLRARHLSGDESTHEELDRYLQRASALLAERTLQAAVGS